MYPTSPGFVRCLGLWLIASLILGAPGQVVAAAPAGGGKVFQALLNAAQKEFDAGNFERAGELFVEIWKQDKATRPALYNAARAYQLGGKLDKADELFREMLALPGLDPATKAKCDAQLATIAERRSEKKAEAAVAAESAGQVAVAAGLWADALRLQPGKLAWVLRLARALHLAGQKAEARAAYAQWLAAAPAEAVDRRQVLAWQDELGSGPAAVAPGGQMTQPPAATATVAIPLASHSQWPAWTALAVGAVGLGSGGVLLALAKADADALQDRFAKRDGAGRIVGLTPGEAATAAGKVDDGYLRGWVATGVGAVALGAGVWLKQRPTAARVAVVPVANGAVCVVRF